MDKKINQLMKTETIVGNGDSRPNIQTNTLSTDNPTKRTKRESIMQNRYKINDKVKNKEDIKIINNNESVIMDKNTNLISDAKKIPIVADKFLSQERLPSQRVPRLYREHLHEFRSEPLDQPEDPEIKSARRKRVPVSGPLMPPKNNAGYQYVFMIQKVFSTIAYMLLSFLAGASLTHTLFVCLLIRFVTLDAGNASKLDASLPIIYAPYTKKIACAYNLIFAIIGVLTFDRCDIGQLSVRCCRNCLIFRNPGVISLFFLVVFGVNNAMYWLNARLFAIGASFEGNVTQFFSQNPEPSSVVSPWLTLEVARTVGVLLLWLGWSFAPTNWNRLLFVLSERFPTARTGRDVN